MGDDCGSAQELGLRSLAALLKKVTRTIGFANSFADNAKPFGDIVLTKPGNLLSRDAHSLEGGRLTVDGRLKRRAAPGPLPVVALAIRWH